MLSRSSFYYFRRTFSTRECRGCEPPAIKAAVKRQSRMGTVGIPSPPAKKRNLGLARARPNPIPNMRSRRTRVRRDGRAPVTATSRAGSRTCVREELRSPVCALRASFASRTGKNGMSRFSMTRSKMKVMTVIKTR